MVRYHGPLGSFDSDFHGMLADLTSTNGTHFATVLIETMYAAQRGELLHEANDGANPGAQVDRMYHCGKQVLEVRMDQMLGWDKDWFPKKRLRLYFAEPDSRDEIWWLHLAPKSTRGNWYEEQNGHIEEAVERAHDWADRNI